MSPWFLLRIRGFLFVFLFFPFFLQGFLRSLFWLFLLDYFLTHNILSIKINNMSISKTLSILEKALYFIKNNN